MLASTSWLKKLTARRQPVKVVKLAVSLAYTVGPKKERKMNGTFIIYTQTA